MKIVVCIKQVPDTKGGVKFNPDGTLDRAAMMTIMNPDDKAGLEAALKIEGSVRCGGYRPHHGSAQGGRCFERGYGYGSRQRNPGNGQSSRRRGHMGYLPDPWQALCAIWSD